MSHVLASINSFSANKYGTLQIAYSPGFGVKLLDLIVQDRLAGGEFFNQQRRCIILRISKKFTFCDFVESVLHVCVDGHVSCTIDKVLFTIIVQRAVFAHRDETIVGNVENNFDISINPLLDIFESS